MANHANLVAEISDHRARLDQNFYDHLRRLRRLHGDAAVDRALAVWRQQRDAVAMAPKKLQRGPQHFRKQV